MVTTTNYTGPNYGPKEGMAYTAVMPQEGFQYTYDQDGTRYQNYEIKVCFECWCKSLCCSKDKEDAWYCEKDQSD